MIVHEGAYPSLEIFYANRGGEVSGECDFGVWWSLPPKGRFPYFRVSVVHSTGDVYALNESTRGVEPLGTVPSNGRHEHGTREDAEASPPCAYVEAERILDGWADMVYQAGSLKWVRERLA